MILTDKEKSDLCLKCLACCKKLGVVADLETLNEQAINFYQTRGCKIIYVNDKAVVYFDMVCPHLSATGCTIYKNRPKVCKNYDGRNSPEMAGICLWGKQPEN